MANHHRGEVDLILPQQTYPLRLTLGALAELEAAFGAADLAALGKRFESGGLKSADIIALLGAAARGGGANISNETLAADIDAADLPAILATLAELLALTFGGEISARPK